MARKAALTGDGYCAVPNASNVATASMKRTILKASVSYSLQPGFGESVWRMIGCGLVPAPVRFGAGGCQAPPRRPPAVASAAWRARRSGGVMRMWGLTNQGWCEQVSRSA